MAISSQETTNEDASGRPTVQLADVVEEIDTTNTGGFTSAPKTGEIWTLHVQCKRAKCNQDRFIRARVDRAGLTYAALLTFKEQLGYCGRDYLYCKKRCGLDVATLEAIDYTKDAARMVEDLAEEMEVRMIVSNEAQDKHVQITPIKRPRPPDESDNDDDDAPGSCEPLDAYKDWLTELEDNSDLDLRDDFRDETIKTYAEWLRQRGELKKIMAYDNSFSKYDTQIDDDSQETNESKDSNDTPPPQWPSHARKNKDNKGFKNRGRGTLKGLAATKKRLKLRTQKLKIEFSAKLGGPCGENARTFVDEVVTFTRLNPPLIGVHSWKDVHKNVRCSIVRSVLDGWDLDHSLPTKDKILKIAKERYKGWRSSLSATYRAYEDYDARMRHKPENLDILEWHYLNLYFGTQKFRIVSSQNSSNRKQIKTLHVTGSKPFSQCSWQERDEETGDEPGPLELWKCTQNKGEKWSNEMAERVYSNALKRVEGESETLKLTVGEEEIIFQDVYKETTGTKPTKVLGCGYLATYPSKTQVLQEKFDRQAREVEYLKERLAKEAADREASREELKNSLREELTKEFNAIMAKNMELALVQKNTPATINLTAAATTGNDANKNVPAADEDRNDPAANGNTNVPAADEITSETAANGNTNESAAKKNTIDATAMPHTADTLQKTAPTTIDAAEPPARSTEETTEDAPPPTNEAPPPQTTEKLQETLPLNTASKKNHNGKFAKCSKGLFKGDGKDGANVAPNAYISSQQLFQHAKTRSALSKMKKQEDVSRMRP